MKKGFIKAISLILTMVMLLGSVAVTAFAKTSDEADTHLQYNEDGTFKIMQISDMQDFFPMRSITKKLLKEALDTQKPDLIVLTGDNISSSSKTKLGAKLAINEFMSIFESYGIPVAMTFGNHDDENTTATKAYQLSVYETYDCFIGCAGEDLGDTNLCSYYVPVYSSTDADKMVSNLWLIDSGNYNSENDLGGYACVTKAQIDWYKAASEQLEYENGHKIPSLMFQHIVVPEVYDALTQLDEYADGAIERDGKYYSLPADAEGKLNESPCPPNYTNGQFEAVVARGDVMGMFFGHDHTNSYKFNYMGVDLVNTPGAGFNSYNNEDVGVRVITLNENNPWNYETQIYSYFDLFSPDDDVARYLFKLNSDTTSTETKFACIFKYIFAVIASLFK